MSTSGPRRTSGGVDLGGFLGGLTNLIEKLGELAETGEELQGLKEFGHEGGVKVEPFGNVQKDERTGRATVREVSEPPVDVFEEADHVLVVAEMPGVGPDDLHLELKDDILTIAADRGPKKYRKEVLLPASFPAEAMSTTCRNGILEIKLAR